MKPTPLVSRLSLAGVLALLASTGGAPAFPPAPHHVLFGTVRDERGNPLAAGSATVRFESASGVVLSGSTLVGVEPGVNYTLEIPMDAGVTADLYKATALTPTVPFSLKVQIGAVTYLPIELKGQFAALGQPGQRTRIDLTLGADTDGDGLPDAWERALLAALGGNLSLADIRPGGDDDGDGLTNLQEYLAGTYAFDKDDGFSLKIERLDAGRPVLKFLAIRGRSYVVQSSADLKTWSDIPFKDAALGASAPSVASHLATDTRNKEVSVAPAAGEQPTFYRLIVR
jgi:Bacterial TSP3 repeat